MKSNSDHPCRHTGGRSHAHAQIDVSNIKSITVNKSASNAAVTGMREIGRSSLECVYKAVAPERGNEQEPVRMKEDRMILQTDGAVSKFYSYYNFAKDSLLKADPNNALKAVEHKNGTAACLYTGYPEAGRLTLTDAVASTYYTYEEKVPQIKWTIGDQTREILGYKCRRADCDLYGRHFTAWFTDEIPVASGPWKLQGLPGLIMAAADDEGLYSFEIIGLRSVERPVEFTDRRYDRDHARKIPASAAPIHEQPDGIPHIVGRDDHRDARRQRAFDGKHYARVPDDRDRLQTLTRTAPRDEGDGGNICDVIICDIIRP
ncbi:MAG: GLPGLI family protein [Bacteroidales bacterium]|nr:MAG: GLPGLI family protein [Bacteroidales bacterium]